METKRYYPTREERVTQLEGKIAKMEALINRRKELIEASEAKLNERKTVLAKDEEKLEKMKKAKETLIELMNKPTLPKGPKLSPEERAEARKAALEKARATRKAKSKMMANLQKALEENGMTLEEVLNKING